MMTAGHEATVYLLLVGVWLLLMGLGGWWVERQK